MADYQLLMSEDDIPMIVDGDSVLLGRALTKHDGEKIVEALNKAGGTALRERILSEVSDAIEGCFD